MPTHTPAPVSTTAPDPLDAGVLVDLAAGLAAARPLWEPHAHHGIDRQPVRLVAADGWEAWIIGWVDGHQVEMHDHGLSAGAIAVVEGTLTELELVDGAVQRRLLPAGTTHALPPGTIHDVLATERATSLHVYGPALTSMTYYDERGRPGWTSLLQPEPPVVDLRSVSRALHPAAARG